MDQSGTRRRITVGILKTKRHVTLWLLLSLLASAAAIIILSIYIKQHNQKPNPANQNSAGSSAVYNPRSKFTQPVSDKKFQQQSQTVTGPTAQ